MAAQHEHHNRRHPRIRHDRLMPPPPPVAGPLRSVEGWVIIVTGVHEEAQEDDVAELFSEHGRIKSIHMNLDRKTGFVKGYALVEYSEREEAQDAINALHGKPVLGRKIGVHWAFCKSTATIEGDRDPRRSEDHGFS
jgi:RNA-binding protein 8A